MTKKREAALEAQNESLELERKYKNSETRIWSLTREVKPVHPGSPHSTPWSYLFLSVYLLPGTFCSPFCLFLCLLSPSSSPEARILHGIHIYVHAPTRSQSSKNLSAVKLQHSEIVEKSWQDTEEEIARLLRPEIRTGGNLGGADYVEIVEGETLVLTTNKEHQENGTSTRLWVDYERLHTEVNNDLTPNAKVLIDPYPATPGEERDALLVLKVTGSCFI